MTVAETGAASADRTALSGHDSPGLPDTDPDTYNAWLRSARLEAVEQLRINAERAGQGAVAAVELSITPELAVEDARVLIRYDASAVLQGEDGEPVGTVATVIALAFAYDGPRPDNDVVGRFALTTGMLVAHPYVRESVQSLAARVGFPQVTLPLVPIKT